MPTCLSFRIILPLLGASGGILGRLGRLLACLGGLLGRLGRVLGRLGRILERLGGLLGHLGRVLERLGLILERLGGVLERLGRVLKRPEWIMLPGVPGTQLRRAPGGALLCAEERYGWIQEKNKLPQKEK